MYYRNMEKKKTFGLPKDPRKTANDAFWDTFDTCTDFIIKPVSKKAVSLRRAGKENSAAALVLASTPVIGVSAAVGAIAGGVSAGYTAIKNSIEK